MVACYSSFPLLITAIPRTGVVEEQKASVVEDERASVVEEQKTAVVDVQKGSLTSVRVLAIFGAVNLT